MKLFSLRHTLALIAVAGAALVATAPASAQGYFRERCNGNGFVNSWTVIGFTAAGAATTPTLGVTSSNRPYAYINATGNPSSGGTAFAVALAPGNSNRSRIRAEVNGAREINPAGMPGLTLAFNSTTGACLLGLLDPNTGAIVIAQKSNAAGMAVQLANGSIPGFDIEEDYKLDFSASGTTLTLRAVKDGVTLATITASNVTFEAGRAGFAVLARPSQTVALRGTFRDIIFNRTTRGDSNNDGSSNVYWHDRSNSSSTRGMVLVWDVRRGEDGSPSISGYEYDDRSTSRLDPSEYTIIGSGDVTGDGRDDIFVRRNSDGRVRVRFVAPGTSGFRLTDDSNGFQPTQFFPDGSGWASIGSAPSDWDAVGVGDFNGDGIADLLWRNRNSGVNGLWLLDASGTITWKQIDGVSDATWKVQAVADFDDDGTCDILWKKDDSGLVAKWLMSDDSRVREFRAIEYAPGWTVVGVGDFDDNPSASDILWMNDTTGAVGCWSMNSNSTIRNWKGMTTIESGRWRGRN